MKKLYSILCTAIIVAGILLPIYTFAQQASLPAPPGLKLMPDNNLLPEVMPQVDVEQLLAEDAVNQQYKGHPLRFGYNHTVNLNMSNSGRAMLLPNGDKLWQVAIKCPGAMTVNLAFSNFHMPEGAMMWVYSKGHDYILGPYTSTNNYADRLMGTDLIQDEEVIVEYYEPVNVSGQGTFNIFRVTHGYKNLASIDFAKAFGDAGNCHNNVNCAAYADWANQKRSVVCLVSGGSEFCTGVVVNNTSNDGTPYVLSANHCGTADGTWIYRFNWEAAGCPDPATNPASQSLTGGTAISNRAGSDFALSRINLAIPANYNVFFAGWNRNNVTADSAVCIHHPQGDIKKISFADNATISGTYNGADCWRVGSWTSGVTEPGSSGSPLFDQDHRIVGQLYGGPSFCGATGTANNDYYGKFSTSWATGTSTSSRLREWLDPTNTGATTNDGYDPNAATIALDAGILSVTAPSGSTCNNTVTPVITVRNYGVNALTAFTITYRIDANTNSTYNWTGNLNTVSNTTITLPALVTTVGAHTFTVIVSSPNGLADLNAANDSTSTAFTITNPATVSLPLTEGFTSTTFPPTGWTRNNPNNNFQWARTTTAGGFGNSSNAARINPSSSNSDPSGQIDELQTPYLDFTNTASPARMTFSVANAKYSNTYYDSLLIFVTTDCGSTWTRVYGKGNTALSTAPNNTGTFVPTAAQWRSDTVNLDAYIGQPFVKVNFQLKNGWGNATFLDDINISAATPVATDAAIGSVTSPEISLCVSNFTPTFTINNFGSDTLTTADVYYQFDNDPAQLYTWSGTLAPQQSEVITLTNTVSTLGNHTFTVFTSQPNGGADGNTGNDTIVRAYSINQPPVVALGNDTATCGQPVVLNAQNAGAAYIWSTGFQFGAITVNQSGAYSVTVTTTAGCTAADAINITVNSVPQVSLGADQVQCNATLTFSAGNNGSTYLWSDGSTTQTISVNTTNTYSVTVTNPAGCTATDAVNVTINPLPQVALALTLDTVCNNQSIFALNGGNPAGGSYTGAAVSGNVFSPDSAQLGVNYITYNYTNFSTGCSNTAVDSFFVRDCTVGINDLSNTYNAGLFPNPFNTTAQLTFTLPATERLTISILDVQGREVMQVADKIFNAGQNQVAVNGQLLQNEVYLLRINSSNGNAYLRIIKAK
jgi:lysyl endopeptidase